MSAYEYVWRWTTHPVRRTRVIRDGRLVEVKCTEGWRHDMRDESPSVVRCARCGWAPQDAGDIVEAAWGEKERAIAQAVTS